MSKCHRITPRAFRGAFCATFVALQLKLLHSCISVLEMDFFGGERSTKNVLK